MFLKYLAAVGGVVLMGVGASAAHGEIVPLTGWTGHGGTWTVSGGDTAHVPNHNYSGVALFVSPDSYSNHVLRGKMWVTETSRYGSRGRLP